MPFTHVVVDGSNIATEGRSIPSLAQLDEAVREFKNEYPQAEITVVVDATFGHRIDASERATFDDAVAHGEMVSPPAGAIGRGDAFLLRIADRSGATVLSNDSFQEFHGEYEWLFTKDRLIGGKPVPAVGWIFTPRTPVRGPKSRESMREARKSRVRVGSKEASQPMPVPKAPPPRPGSGTGKARKAGLSEAIAAATEEVVSPEAPGSSRRRRRRGSGPPTEAVNDPLSFIQFIADHPLGSEVQGEVDSFASHGAFVMVGPARCYLPLSAMGDPPPRSAREALNRGEQRTFVLQALDPQRRGIELALPGHAHVSGSPLPETVEAEISEAPRGEAQGARPAARTTRKGRAAKAPATMAAAGTAEASAAADDATAPLKGGARKAAAKKPTGAKTANRKPASARKATADQPVAPGPPPKKPTKKAAAATKPAASKAPATKAGTKKAGVGKAAAAKATKAARAGSTAAKAAAIAAEPAPAQQSPARRTAARKAPAAKAPAKKTPAKKEAAKKTVVKKTVVKKSPAKKEVARKSAAKRAPGGQVPTAER